ncbi:MAG: (Fe-S)-binding protein [Proteobacteria bacterium]|nr:(Fe-S)-binding protein [Pseudomonadota bacterium]
MAGSHTPHKPASYIDAFRDEDCIECGDCLSGCKYMDLDAEEAVEGVRRLRAGADWGPYLDRCVFCAQCNLRCPVDAQPAALILERLRERRRDLGHLPGFFAYYLNGMERLGSSENYFKDIYLASNPEAKKIIDEWSEPKQGDDLLWCGCGNRINPQNIEHSKILADLPKFGGVSDCCGVNAAKTGLYDTARHVTDNLIERLSQCRFKRLVVSCGSCQEHFRLIWPAYFGQEFPFEVISLYEYIDEQMAKGKFSVQRTVGLEAALSDACYGHLFGEKYLGTVRRLCQAVGIDTVPLAHQGADTACCGVAGFARNLDAAGVLEAMKIKAGDIRQSGRDNVLHYCMGCHTITSMTYRVKSHYLLDKVLWALGDEMTSSIFIPKSVREKAVMKYQDPGRFRLQMI